MSSTTNKHLELDSTFTNQEKPNLTLVKTVVFFFSYFFFFVKVELDRHLQIQIYLSCLPIKNYLICCSIFMRKTYTRKRRSKEDFFIENLT